MGKYTNIAVIYGSDTSEWEISCLSGRFVASQIDGRACDVYEIFARFGKWSLVASRTGGGERTEIPDDCRPDVDKNDFSVTTGGRRIKFDYAYIVQHGSPGETGQLQGYFEMLGIPFNTCSSFVSAIAFDKYTCKHYFDGEDYVKCAADALLREGADIEKVSAELACRLSMPLFVKPSSGGSSFGITKVKTEEQLPDAIRKAFAEGGMVIVEQALTGREFTCAVYSDANGPRVLPVCEIIPENEFFDYDAKYNGQSREVCPAAIPEAMTENIVSVSERIYSRLGCRGLVRFDYIYAEDGLYFLEANTVPGMTAMSLVPRMLSVAGIPVSEFLATVMENS